MAEASETVYSFKMLLHRMSLDQSIVKHRPEKEFMLEFDAYILNYPSIRIPSRLDLTSGKTDSEVRDCL